MNKTDKFLKGVSSNFIYILLLIVCIVYPLTRLAEIVKTNKGLLDILASIGISFFFALSISILWGEKGTENGLQAKTYLDTKDNYNDAVEEITPHIEKIDNGCDYINEQDKIKKQTVILKRAGLSYNKFINGEYDTFTKKENKAKYEAIKKAREVTDININSIVLLSECESNITGVELSETIVQHKSKSVIKKVSSKILSATIFGLYTINLLEDFSWLYIIWGFVEVLLYLLLGFINYLNEYNYIVTKRRQQMVLKMDFIYLILNLIKNKPYLFEEEKETLVRANETLKGEQFIIQPFIENPESEV